MAKRPKVLKVSDLTTLLVTDLVGIRQALPTAKPLGIVVSDATVLMELGEAAKITKKMIPLQANRLSVLVLAGIK